jgi:hypothetical protein
MKNSVHLVLQGKGGIGKTLVASLVAQYLDDRHTQKIRCFDTDQENATLSRYEALNVTPVDVMNADRTINRKKFDGMLLEVLNSKDNIVIDSGANTFSPLMSYLLESDFLALLEEAGKRVYLHTIIGGGDNLADTSAGFVSLASQTSCPIVIWLNENASWGTTEDFIDSQSFTENAEHVRGIVLLQGRNSDTYGDDIRKMNKARVTIKQIRTCGKFNVLEISRLTNVVNDVFSKLDTVEW